MSGLRSTGSRAALRIQMTAEEALGFSTDRLFVLVSVEAG